MSLPSALATTSSLPKMAQMNSSPSRVSRPYSRARAKGVGGCAWMRSRPGEKSSGSTPVRRFFQYLADKIKPLLSINRGATTNNPWRPRYHRSYPLDRKLCVPIFQQVCLFQWNYKKSGDSLLRFVITIIHVHGLNNWTEVLFTFSRFYVRQSMRRGIAKVDAITPIPPSALLLPTHQRPITR